jgi:DNA-directed RNA polymerase subunit H (RpoH/RPB5)
MAEISWDQWRVFLTMMYDRNYIVDEWMNWDMQTFKNYFKHDVRQHTIRGMSSNQVKYIEPLTIMHTRGNFLLVFFLPNKKIDLPNVQKWVIPRSVSEQIDDLLLIYHENFTSSTLSNLVKTKQEIEMKHVHFFNYNVIQHDSQPTYDLLTYNEEKELCETLNIKPDQLPKLKPDDSVYKYYGYHKHRGRIVQMIRNNPPEVMYRYIV